MGWEMPWYTITDGFDVDFGVDEWHGTNVFIRDRDRVFRTYFINNRGDEKMGGTWSYLDLTALGRQEEWEDSPDGYPQTPPYQWWNWHDEYKDAPPSESWLAMVERGVQAFEGQPSKTWTDSVTTVQGARTPATRARRWSFAASQRIESASVSSTGRHLQVERS